MDQEVKLMIANATHAFQRKIEEYTKEKVVVFWFTASPTQVETGIQISKDMPGSQVMQAGIMFNAMIAKLVGIQI